MSTPEVNMDVIAPAGTRYQVTHRTQYAYRVPAGAFTSMFVGGSIIRPAPSPAGPPATPGIR